MGCRTGEVVKASSSSSSQTTTTPQPTSMSQPQPPRSSSPVTVVDDSFNKVYSYDALSCYNLLHQPIWVFDVINQCMYWANDVGLDFWQAKTVDDLCSRSFKSNMSDAVNKKNLDMLERFKRNERWEETWTLFPGGVAQTVTCQFSGIHVVPVASNDEDDDDGDGHLCMLVHAIPVQLPTDDPKNSSSFSTLLQGEAMLKYLPISVCQFDLDGTLKYQNPEACHVFGWGNNNPNDDNNENDNDATTSAPENDASDNVDDATKTSSSSSPSATPPLDRSTKEDTTSNNKGAEEVVAQVNVPVDDGDGVVDAKTTETTTIRSNNVVISDTTGGNILQLSSTSTTTSSGISLRVNSSVLKMNDEELLHEMKKEKKNGGLKKRADSTSSSSDDDIRDPKDKLIKTKDIDPPSVTSSKSPSKTMKRPPSPPPPPSPPSRTTSKPTTATTSSSSRSKNHFVNRFVDREEGMKIFQQIKDGKDISVEVLLYTKKGPEWNAIHTRLGNDSNSDKKKMIYFSARNISDIVNAKREIQLNHERAEFFAIMAHEIRTPLFQVTGFIDLLDHTTNLTNEQKGYVQVLKSSASGLMAVINDVLDYSKLEAGKMKIEMIPFEPKAVADASLAAVAVAAEDKGLVLKSSFPPRVPVKLVGDPNRLRQILSNLLNNAVKFTHKGSIELSVEMATTTTESSDPLGRVVLRFAVQDTGIGIDPSHLTTIFRKYSQATASISSSYGGTGLGLSICKSLVACMDGRIGVESVQGKGSKFWFEVPFPRPSVADLPPESPESVKSEETKEDHHVTSLRVLVAEDNGVNQKLISRMLSRLGHKVTVVDNGEEAVREVQNRVYDLVLMDIQMPVMDGIDATKEIRCLGLTLPIVGLSASVRLEDFEGIGLSGWIGKPVRLKELQSKITETFQ